jgi:VWFA-related protein
MKNNLAIKSLTILIAALMSAVTSIPIAAQSSDKPATFGSSLKKPETDTKREAEEQSSQKPVEEDLPHREEIIRINTSLVNLDVLVTDATGARYVTGLTKEDFVIAEDDQPQTITTLTVGDDAAGLPRSIVLLFDRSQSEFPYLDASIEAAKALVNQLAPSDEMAIVTDDVELAIGFTKDKKKVKQTLDLLRKLTINGYKTRSMQFSALLATLRELIDSSRKRPIIIFQTDGDEAFRLEQQRPSTYDLNTVYSEVEKSRAKIYTVIPNIRLIDIPQEEIIKRIKLMGERAQLARSKYKDMWFGLERVPPETNKTQTGKIQMKLPDNVRENILRRNAEGLIKGQSAAARVADLTGGWTSFLQQQEQASEIYERILADINHRYIISYYPTNKTRDGKLRKVHITIKGHPDYVVQGRTSYYATSR